MTGTLSDLVEELRNPSPLDRHLEVAAAEKSCVTAHSEATLRWILGAALDDLYLGNRRR